jgi:hypothetical protein
VLPTEVAATEPAVADNPLRGVLAVLERALLLLRCGWRYDEMYGGGVDDGVLGEGGVGL